LTSTTPTATSRSPASFISSHQLDLGHLAVGELEDELVTARVEERRKERPVLPRRGERPVV
jgi:hypothetical protein